MSSSKTVTADTFALSLQQMLDEVEDATEDALDAGLKAGAKLTRSEWKANAPVRTGAYAKSIKYTKTGKGSKPAYTVYSTMPGLPHLLEKGHAKVGGGRVAAQVHIRPAADDGFEEAAKVAEEELKL